MAFARAGTLELAASLARGATSGGPSNPSSGCRSAQFFHKRAMVASRRRRRRSAGQTSSSGRWRPSC
eukprot:5122904-Lingulodinium_polyedra.AAC.1